MPQVPPYALLIPSYKKGFARNKAESEAPLQWDGLIGAWAPFLGPTGSNLFDVSGYGNHGVLTNMGPEDWEMSVMGWCLDFDGGNDHVLMSGSASLFDTGGNPFTIVVFVNRDDLDTGDAHVVTNTSGGGVGFRMGLDNTNIVEIKMPGQTNAVISGITNTRDVFELFAIIQTSPGEWRAWLNTKTDVDSAGTPGTPAGDLAIGADNDGDTSTSLDGKVSDVRFYNRALSANEIAEIYKDPYAMYRLKRRRFNVPTETITVDKWFSGSQMPGEKIEVVSY